jgi:hypothetical protein
VKAPAADSPKSRVIEDGMFRGALHGDAANVTGFGDEHPEQDLPLPALLTGETWIRRRGVAVVTGDRFDEGGAGARLSLSGEDG